MYTKTVIATLFSIAVAHAYAESEFVSPPISSCRPYEGLVDNKDGTLTDKRNGLIWMRCDIGAKFEKGKGCVGKEKQLSWLDAMLTAKKFSKDGFNDWRLPTVDEVNQVVDLERNCFPRGQFFSPVPGTAAVDLRLFSKSAGDSNYRIQTLQPFKEWRSDDGWPGALVWAVDLRYGFHNGNSNEYYLDVQTTPGFSNANTKGFVKLVRQPENGGGPNMTLVDSLLTKYIEGPAAKLRERNATQDAFNENKKRESDARARKSRAAME